MLHDLDHLSPVLAGQSGIVFHIYALGHKLSTHSRCNDQRTQVGTCCIDGSRHPGRTTPNDHHALNGTAAAISVQRAGVVTQPQLLFFGLGFCCILFAPLNFPLQFFQGSCLQVWTSCKRLTLGLVRFLLRLWSWRGLRSLTVLLFQQPDHGWEILAVLLQNRVDAFFGCFCRIMLVVELLQRLACHNDIVPICLIDQLPGPFPKRVLISTGKLVPLLATEPELEGGHRTDALLTCQLLILGHIHLAKISLAREVFGDLAENRRNHVARTAGHTIKVQDDGSSIGFLHEILEFLGCEKLFHSSCSHQQRQKRPKSHHLRQGRPWPNDRMTLGT
mmetsp:Transcript_68747/g.151409  ORF Transcript_68747/g.151409 Transcript_68747/m.151409 type:complete len:333 (+) Transcript_68747:962-1960(+)